MFFSYEDLTDNSEIVVRKIIDFLPELEQLRTNVRFKTRNIGGSPIVGFKNLNEMKIQKLSETEIAEINTVLIKHQDVLEFFRYEMIQR